MAAISGKQLVESELRVSLRFIIDEIESLEFFEITHQFLREFDRIAGRQRMNVVAIVTKAETVFRMIFGQHG